MEIVIFLEILAALWLVGSALALGLYISRRNRCQGGFLIGYAWSLIFSWAFVGWIAGELIALAFKTTADSHLAMSARPEEKS